MEINMKKVVMMLAVGAASFSAVPVFAQSSVTLYGILDDGFAYTNNNGGHSQYFMNSGNLQGDRWGLRGSEDLGGGFKTLFVLENGFSIATGKLGQGGDEFGRQAYVGLSKSDVGTITLGRQYDSVVDYVGAFAAENQWASGYALHPGDMDNLSNSFRVNNSIKFQSTTFSGLSFGALYSLGGVAGSFSRNSIWSMGAGYASGPLNVGVGYVDVKNPNISYYGNNATSSATASNDPYALVYSGYASASAQKIFAAGAAYTIGSATLGGTYSNIAFVGIPSASNGNASARFNNVEANFKYQITPALVAGVALDYTKGYNLNHAQYKQGTVGVDYFISKRTDVFADVTYQHAQGTDSTGAQATAVISTLSPSSDNEQVAAVIGIRHKF
jgi:predicted porin